MDDQTTGTERRRGRPPAAEKSDMVKVTMLLPPGDTDWAKSQPEGLSGLVRRLLAEARTLGEGKKGKR